MNDDKKKELYEKTTITEEKEGTSLSKRASYTWAILLARLFEIFPRIKKTGETLKNFPLTTGDIALADRAYFHSNAIVEAVNME